MKLLCVFFGHRWLARSQYGSGQPRCIACARCGHETILIPMVRA